MTKFLLAGLIGLASVTVTADDFLNIRTNPLMVLSGQFVNLGLDFRLTDHWSLGPTVQAQTNEPLYEVGLRATYFEQGTYNRGWQTGIDVSYQLIAPDNAYFDGRDNYCLWNETTMTEECGDLAESYLEFAVNHGYLWRWDRFNVELGLGSALASKIAEPTDMRLLSNVYLSLGWIR